MAGELIVLVTCPAASALDLSRAIVAERLAACVNIVGSVTSIFVWQGNINLESEELLIIKSSRSLWPALEKRVKELHAYQTPEIICFPIEDGYKPYLDWLNSSLRQ